jgi:hypothetical protein
MTLGTTTLGEKLREAIEKKSLATTINQWDDEDSATKQNIKDIPVLELQDKTKSSNSFAVTTNASRVTFDYVFNHAGSTVTEVATALEKQGQKVSTVTSLCYQMVKNGMFRKTSGGKLFPLVNQYEPLKNSKQLRNKAIKESGFSDAPKKKVVIITRRTGSTVDAGGIAALKQEEAPKRMDPYKWNADEYIEGLSVLQARELYLKLKEIFGG